MAKELPQSGQGLSAMLLRTLECLTMFLHCHPQEFARRPRDLRWASNNVLSGRCLIRGESGYQIPMVAYEIPIVVLPAGSSLFQVYAVVIRLTSDGAKAIGAAVRVQACIERVTLKRPPISA